MPHPSRAVPPFLHSKKQRPNSSGAAYAQKYSSMQNKLLSSRLQKTLPKTNLHRSIFLTVGTGIAPIHAYTNIGSRALPPVGNHTLPQSCFHTQHDTIQRVQRQFLERLNSKNACRRSYFWRFTMLCSLNHDLFYSLAPKSQSSA